MIAVLLIFISFFFFYYLCTCLYFFLFRNSTHASSLAAFHQSSRPVSSARFVFFYRNPYSISSCYFLIIFLLRQSMQWNYVRSDFFFFPVRYVITCWYTQVYIYIKSDIATRILWRIKPQWGNTNDEKANRKIKKKIYKEVESKRRFQYY